jgi:hypothetical protein
VKTTTYRGLTIQHPVITPDQVKDICDWYGTTFHIVELDRDSGSLPSAKMNIDSLYQEMEQFNTENNEDAVSDILEYIEACLYV